MQRYICLLRLIFQGKKQKNIYIISMQVTSQMNVRCLSSSKKSRSSRQKLQSSQRSDRIQKDNTYLLATKFGDISQRNQTTCSKQLKSTNKVDNTQYIRNLYKKYLGKENTNCSQRKINHQQKSDLKDPKMQKIHSMQYQHCRRQKLTYEIETAHPLKDTKKQKDNKNKKQDKQNKQVNDHRYQQEHREHRERRESKVGRERQASLGRQKMYSDSIERMSTNRKVSLLAKKSEEEISNHSQIINKQVSQNVSSKFYEQLKNSQLLNIIGDQTNSLVLAMKIINGVKTRCK